MDRIHSLLEWAAPKGVQISGVLPQAKKNCGIGMTATKTIQKGDVLVTVPTRTMRDLATVSAAIRAKLPPKMSIHGLLAADLILNPPPESWMEVLPTIAEFSSMPFFWPRAAQELLPGTAKHILNEQQSNVRRDCEQFQSGYPHVALDDYIRAWFVVSTRAFYQETRQTLLYPWHDRLALMPVADLFNHAAAGCKASYDADSYTIIADREYLEGDEVYISYGQHSNDFLLAEYGFLLQNNTNDRFNPEDLVSSKLNAEDTALLRQMKTLPALRQVCGSATEAEPICDDEGWFEDTSGSVDDVRLQELLEKFLETINGYLQDVLALDDGNQGYQTLLLQRWNQIDELDHCGQTALHWAVARNSPITVRRLLKGKASASVQASDGSTAMHIAAYTGHLDIVTLLLEDKTRRERRRGRTASGPQPRDLGVVNLAATNANGFTAKTVAELVGHYEVADVLRAAARGEPAAACNGSCRGPARRTLYRLKPRIRVRTDPESDYLQTQDGISTVGIRLMNDDVQLWLYERSKLSQKNKGC